MGRKPTMSNEVRDKAWKRGAKITSDINKYEGFDKMADTIDSLNETQSETFVILVNMLEAYKDIWMSKEARKHTKKADRARMQHEMSMAYALAFVVEMLKDSKGKDPMATEDDEEWYRMMVDEFDSNFVKATKSKKFQKVWKKRNNK